MLWRIILTMLTMQVLLFRLPKKPNTETINKARPTNTQSADGVT